MAPLPAASAPRRFESWGGAIRAEGVRRPVASAGDVAAVLREEGPPAVLRGAGCSYGDASLLPGGRVVETGGFDRILEWDPATGVVVAEPGVTVDALWRRGLPDGWWPPVVPGTGAVTLGGALAANVHGKNASRAGPLGEHVAWFDLLVPDGSTIRCAPDREGEIFRAAVGGFGLLGAFTRIALRMRRVASGLVEVRPRACRDLGALLAALREEAAESEYAVGWVDGFARGTALGRGLVHGARHLGAGEDDAAARSLGPAFHGRTGPVLGVFPRSQAWRALRFFAWEGGMRLLNRARWESGNRAAAPRRAGIVAYSFLLDAIPGWRRAYGPRGMIQFQTFVPGAAAEAVFAGQIRAAQEAGLPPWLAVAKVHRRDGFLLSHGVDGFSLALDFPVPKEGLDRLRRLLLPLAADVVAAGGRFYLAKDAVLTADLYRASLPEGTLDRFRRLKARLDPKGVLRSALAERVGLL